MEFRFYSNKELQPMRFSFVMDLKFCIIYKTCSRFGTHLCSFTRFSTTTKNKFQLVSLDVWFRGLLTRGYLLLLKESEQ